MKQPAWEIENDLEGFYTEKITFLQWIKQIIKKLVKK